MSSQVLAASPVKYSITPASGAYQPGATVAVELSVTTTQAMAGASVDVSPTNMTFSAFTTANSPQFIMVDYHAEARDVIAICQGNNCPPGTYKIGTLYFTAGSSGSMSIVLTPVETADPNLQPIAADGATYNYTINASAPATTTPPPKKSTYTVPRTGSGPVIVPEVIDEEQRLEEDRQVATQTPASNNQSQQSQKEDSKKTSILPWLVAIPIAITTGLVSSLIFNRQRRGPRGYIVGGSTYSQGTSDDDIHKPPSSF